MAVLKAEKLLRLRGGEGGYFGIVGVTLGFIGFIFVLRGLLQVQLLMEKSCIVTQEERIFWMDQYIPLWAVVLVIIGALLVFYSLIRERDGGE